MAKEEITYDGRVTHVQKTTVCDPETGAELAVGCRVDVAVVSDDVPDIPGGLSKVGHRVLHN